jgi:hypothetical protein
VKSFFWLSLADHWCLGSGSPFCVLSPDGQEVLCWLFSEWSLYSSRCASDRFRGCFKSRLGTENKSLVI